MPENDDDGDDFEDKLGAMMMEEDVGSPPGDTAADTTDQAPSTGSTDSTDSTESTESTKSTDATAETEADSGGGMRNRRVKLPIYLLPEFKSEVNDAYTKRNAQRVVDDEGEIEKHRHFLEAVLRAGLESDDLDEYINDMVERY